MAESEKPPSSPSSESASPSTNVLKAETASFSATDLTATARSRMNFANTHLFNAHRFALRVHEVETTNAGEPFGAFWESIQADTLAAIMSSVASLEAFVNEAALEPRAYFPMT